MAKLVIFLPPVPATAAAVTGGPVGLIIVGQAVTRAATR